MLKLQFKDPGKAAIWLVDSRYSIGRDKSNDIVIDEEGISGFHAELRVEDDDRIFLTDAGSINGTFVNGKQVKARTQLRANDVISIYHSELRLVDPKELLQVQPPEDLATAMTPALQGLHAGAEKGIGGVPTGWLLRAKTGAIAGQAFPVPASGRAILGRSQNCDIVIPGTHVSRQHAELYFQSGKLHVKDLGSSNGTFVNRKKVEDAVLSSGDEVRFDTLVFQIEAPQEAVAPAASEANVDSTMFRPAIGAEPKVGSVAAPKPAMKPAPALSGPASAPAASSQSKSSNAGPVIGLLVVALVLGAAAVWYFL